MNLSKSVDVFDPASLTGTQVLVIGLGATGSFVAMNLVKMGVEDIIFFDYDIVEEKNVNNQLYGLNHVGMPKTQAMYQILSSFNPAIKEEQFINEKFDMSKHKRYFSKKTVVYLLVDHNRQALLTDLFKSPNVHYLIETRIGVDVFDIYKVGKDKKKREIYLESVPTLEMELNPRELSPCGEVMSIVPAINMCGALAAQLIRQLDEPISRVYIETYPYIGIFVEN